MRSFCHFCSPSLGLEKRFHAPLLTAIQLHLYMSHNRATTFQKCLPSFEHTNCDQSRMCIRLSLSPFCWVGVRSHPNATERTESLRTDLWASFIHPSHINRAKLFTENSTMARRRDIHSGWGLAVLPESLYKCLYLTSSPVSVFRICLALNACH